MSAWTKADEVGAEAAAAIEAKQALVPKRGFQLSPEHKSLKVRGGMLIAAQVAFILMNALGIAITVVAASFVERALAGAFASEEAFQNEAVFLESMANALFWTSIAVLVVCFVTYSLFIYGAARNIERSNAQGLEVSAKWAVGWSFVPFANLFKPYVVMGQIWKASHDPVRTAVEKPGYMILWWLSYILGNIVSNITRRMIEGTDDPEQIVALGWVEAGASGLSIIAGATLIIIVRQVMSAQERWPSISSPQV
jgi:Domain of unknown function (DUF4328)